jgi:hypothetical protein
MSSTEPWVRRSTWGIFRFPVLIATISGCGLVLALLTDGPLDVLWSCSVAAPVLVLVSGVLRALFAAAKRRT